MSRRPRIEPLSSVATSAIGRRSIWDFVVEEIESAARKAISVGAQLAGHKWGKLALMVDPFGHGLCFVEFLGRSYDESR
ncbi:MAG: VOC family protein [Chromatiales bacterium]